MNMHVPQCIQTGMELKYLTAVPNHFISPSTNKPIIKPSQDNLLGAFRITADDVLLTQSDAMHLLAGTEAFKGVLPEPEIREGKYIRWTGKQIYSVILPPLSLVSKPDNDRLKKVIIEDGILKQGQIEGGSSGKIIMAIHSDFGSKETERYMNDLQLIVSRYLVKTGFSVGPSDLLLHPDIRDRNHKLIQEAFNKEVDLAKKFHLNIIEDITGNMADIYEANVNKISKTLNDSITEATMKTIDLQNRVYTMIASGAKGSDTNIKQMMCLLGQQTIDGARVPIGFTDRTLPHYPRYENGMESRGFISHCFLEGLNPKEFFFHAMSGREGLIDTAVKTANSGYLQRKLVKAMEDLKTYYDGSIRDNGGEIIEFVYGADGFNSSKIEQQSTEFKLITTEKLYDNYMFREAEDFTGYMLKKAIDGMKRKYPDWFKRLDGYNKSVQTCIDIYHTEMTKLVAGIDDVKLYHPVNFTKLISKATSIFKLNEITAKSNMNPVEVLERIDELISDCSVGRQSNNVFATLVYDFLSPKRVLRDYKMTSEALEYVCTNARLVFRKALAHAGDMVGPMAAQSIGERTTQMTLNSVEWDTDMLFLKNGNGLEVQMGAFIDELMDKYKGTDRIKLIPENRTEYLELDPVADGRFKVPSSDNLGNVSWCDVTAVTRHLPVGDLVEITTETGRTVAATQQKAFLIWDFDQEKLVEKNGKDLVVGDCVAVTNNFPEPSADEIITELDMSQYFPKTKYIHGSEYHKCGEMYDADTREKKIGFWSKNGNDFTVPYARLDSFVDAWKGKKMIHTKIESGFIYPKKTHSSHSRIPERIPLDEEFGFIIGLYLAEGWCTNTFWGISNNDETIRKRVTDWCDKLSLAYTIRSTKDAVFKKGTPEEYCIKETCTDVIIHCVFMARFLKKWLGTGSAVKIVPPEAYIAPKPFVRALIDGYISGDGSVDNKVGCVSASTVSKSLCYGIAALLTRFGIMTQISGNQPIKRECDRIATEDCLYNYTLNMRKAESIKFARLIGCSHLNKKDRLEKITLAETKKTNKGKPYNPRADVILDKIQSIKFKKSAWENVYDLTVPKTLNFSILNGIAESDTFHLAGVSEKGKVTQGVPRLNEVLKVTKKPKNPSNIIFLRGEERFDRDHAERVKNSIEQTKIGEIIKGDPTFYLEPTNKITGAIEEDRDFLKFYEVFAELDGALAQTAKNPWIIRMEFDRKEMIYRNITMADVEIVLKMILPDATVMYSDDNAGKMVFRIRMPFESRENVEDDYKMLRLKANDLRNIIIKGVDLIQKVYINAPSKDCVVKGKGCRGMSKVGDTYEVREEYSLTTDGANLFDLMMRDDIDATRCYSIDPNEMNRIFGIEAGKFIVEQQFREILASSGAPTSPRHIGLLVNKMAHSGDFMSVDRFGINREDIGPLAKCSFEKTPDLLRDAALFGEVDKLKGISANIMVGQIPECGTGSVKVFLDEVYLVQELKKRGIKPDEPASALEVADVFKEFQQKICVSADDQIRMNIHAFEADNLNLSHIPEVFVE